MVDQLIRVKELLARLQDGDRRRGVTAYLDDHQADVRELADLKGNAMVEQFLGLRAGSIGQWRTTRGFTDTPEEANRKAAARRREMQECLSRLNADRPLHDEPRGRWLDDHREDLELALSFGVRHGDLAETLHIPESTFRTWTRRRQVITPRQLEASSVEATETPDGVPTELPVDDGPPLSGYTAKQLQNEVSRDINAVGLKRAWKLWHERGITAQRWGVAVKWARERGLIPAKAGGSDEAGARPRSDRYLLGKYEGMREALLIIFGRKRDSEEVSQ
jgi:hypothetical protein